MKWSSINSYTLPLPFTFTAFGEGDFCTVVVKDLRLKDEDKDKDLMSMDEEKDEDLKIDPRGQGLSSRTTTL